ncbi:disulfide bond formation protein DsbA [Rhodobacteraceae bacterium WD3A24]|nr:disulfide bond formation protein DsbA [Rhodobacteraceae bacterium WD3A24]
MIRTLLGLALSAVLALPVAAFDVENMTNAERQAFRAEIRDYLLDNPEVILEAVQVLEERQQSAQAEGDMNMVQANGREIFNDGHSWVGGDPEGDITLVEFSDYRCSFCRRAHPEVMDMIADDGDIRYIVKEFPILGEQSERASRYAISVLQLEGDAAYARAHDTLMTYRGEITRRALASISEDLGVDHDAITARMDAPEVTEVIEQNRALATQLQINGTPTFVLEDQMLRGYLPRGQMEQMIAQMRNPDG